MGADFAKGEGLGESIGDSSSGTQGAAAAAVLELELVVGRVEVASSLIGLVP